MSVLDLPYVIGDFVWTGYDYLGEAAIGRTRWDGETVGSETWPWTVAFCGDLDLCGYRRPQSYYREAAWGLRPTVACFVQQPGRPDKMWDGVSAWGWIDEQASWTWPGQEGKPLVVQAYSSCPHVRLTLNGRDLGMKDTDRRTHFTATWKVPYEPGQLTVFGEDARGHEQARWALRTAGQPAAVRLTPDRPKIHADGQDLCFVTVEVVDERGVVNPTAANLVKFSVAGPASVLAVSNGDPRSTESFQQPQRKAFRGRCQVVVKAGRQAGPIRLRAEAQGLKSGEIVIEARALVASEP
jgi:beta-galactosidase